MYQCMHTIFHSPRNSWGIAISFATKMKSCVVGTPGSTQKALLKESGDGIQEEEVFNKGLRFIATKPKKEIFIASTKNTFGGIQFRKVKVDSGADGLLLYFPDDQAILDFDAKFCSEQYIVETNTGSGVTSPIYYVTVKLQTLKPFRIRLCCDLLPNSAPFAVGILKFVLTYKDVHFIHDNAGCVNLRKWLKDSNSYGIIEALILRSNFAPRRRTHVLLGQTILELLSSHEHDRFMIAYDHRLLFTGNYDHLCQRIGQQLRPNGTGTFAEFYSELEDEPNEEVNTEGEYKYTEGLTLYIMEYEC